MIRFLPFLVPSDGHRDELEASCHSESGDTLIEVLIALVVIGVASLSILLAFSTSIWGSADYRVTATVDTALRSAAEESTTTLDQLSTTIWGTCSDASTEQLQLRNAVNSVLPPTNYTATESIAYWNGQSFTGTCVANAAQQITVTVSYKGTAYSIATVVDDPVVPTINVGVTAAKLAFVEQPPSSGIAAGSAISPWPMVAIEDVNSLVVQDDLSAATLTLSSGGQTCAGIENLGVFTFSNCVIKAAGTYTLKATDGSLPSATSSPFTVGASVPTQLAFTTSPPATAGAGATFSVVVAEEDSYGNTETGDSSSSVSLAATSGSGFTCSTTPTQFTSGVATFTGCYYTAASTTAYTLTASSGILFPATANTTVSAGTASKLIYTTSPPAATTAGTTFSVVVAEQDAYGNLDSSDSTTAVSLAANQGGGGFACTTTPAHLTNGAASFTGCSYKVASTTAYTLTASSGSLTSATATTTVSSAAASKLVITTQPASVINTGGTVSVGVTIEDSYGNTITTGTGSNDSISVALHSGSFAAGTTTVTASNGVASFTGLQIKTAGWFTIIATDNTESLTSATTNTITVNRGAASQLVILTGPQSFITGTGTAKGSGAITVQLQDANGNPVDVTTAAPLTFTTPSGAKFVPTFGSTTACSSTTCTIAIGSSTATFYMTDTTTGSAVIAAIADGITSQPQTETVLASGTFSGSVTVTAQSGTLAPTGTAVYSVTVKNTASSTRYVEVFAEGLPNSATSTLSSACVTLAATNGSETLPLSVTTNGSTPVSISTFAILAEAWTNSGCSSGTMTDVESSGTLTITSGTASQLAIMTAPVSGTHGATRTIGPILVQEEDQYGNRVAVGTATTVNLTSTSGTGTFAATSGGGAVTSVTIASGSTYQIFYYGDTVANTPTITATAGSLSWSQIVTVS
ncbi:MAG: type II secretion system protein [Acidimicrobiales bacterium]|jgi:hypothetical protein